MEHTINTFLKPDFFLLMCLVLLFKLVHLSAPQYFYYFNCTAFHNSDVPLFIYPFSPIWRESSRDTAKTRPWPAHGPQNKV